ncbi:dITP/XTP pyrophosphatase [Balamuthia mandrillaris]
MKKAFAVVLATQNPMKVVEVRNVLAGLSTNWRLVEPQDLTRTPIEVEEDADTLEGNAIKKAEAYSRLLLAGSVQENVLEGLEEVYVVGDDTGLEIDALNGEPGIKVRRWKDGKTAMKDEELIEYCLRRMKDVPKAQRTARFKAVVAAARLQRINHGKDWGAAEEPIQLFEGTLQGRILEEADPLRLPGFPFESLFVVEEEACRRAAGSGERDAAPGGVLLGRIQQMKPEEKKLFPTHRQKAWETFLRHHNHQQK